MEMIITEQGTENMEYVRKLLSQKQHGFATELESALTLTEQELQQPGIPTDFSADAEIRQPG